MKFFKCIIALAAVVIYTKPGCPYCFAAMGLLTGRLAAAQALLGTWFDPASRRTQAAATLLQQVQGLTKAADLPRVQDTLIALSNAVAASGPAPGGK